jgi:hypothetical protein
MERMIMRTKYLSLALAVLILATVVPMALGADNGKGNDRVLSKVTFIHHRKAHAKPPNVGKPTKPPKDDGYYTYISSGARWRTTETFLLNPDSADNPGGVLDDVIYDAVLAGIQEWETPGTTSLTIFGSLLVDDSVAYNDGNYRGYNTVSFGGFDDPSVIAITSVWGYFGGKPSGREIIEAHILFNDAFEWGDAAEDGDGDGSPDLYLMDIQNIATHELGHVVGMGDVYNAEATAETMYGYSTEGDLEKRDLYKGDIAGVTKLYK